MGELRGGFDFGTVVALACHRFAAQLNGVRPPVTYVDNTVKVFPWLGVIFSALDQPVISGLPLIHDRVTTKIVLRGHAWWG